MKSNKLISNLKKYIKFIPFYIVGSGCAFTIDLTVFTLLRTSLGSNISAIIAFAFGTITSFLVLSSILEYRLRKKRFGIIIQLLIGLGTLLINIMVLNIIDYSSEKINHELYINNLDKSHYYALFSKIIASCIGFLWTSTLTGKFLFKKK
tara:strand:+ start:42 stop:491 length:450 start_codon:yes stop_codon:yes gene_type:complete